VKVKLVGPHILNGPKPVRGETAWIVTDATTGWLTTNIVGDAPEPDGLITVMGPVVAVHGSVAVICVGLTTVNVAGVTPNITVVVPVNPVPLIVTSCALHAQALRGLNDVTVVCATTVGAEKNIAVRIMIAISEEIFFMISGFKNILRTLLYIFTTFFITAFSPA
jgi:hypothetical protein